MKKYPGAVRFSFYTAVVSFLTAATIFTLYFFSVDFILAIIGFFSVLIFGAINVVVLLVLTAVMAKKPEMRRVGTFAMFAQLANIPVALFCLWAGSHLSTIARITFINETGSELQNVQIIGCDDQVIEHLEPGESETRWLYLTHDCSVHLEYVQNDSTVNCEVYGYLCQGMGMVYTHRIGGSNDQSSAR